MAKIEDYAFLSDTQSLRVGQSRRLGRLALFSAFRFRRLFRRIAWRGGKWPLDFHAEGEVNCDASNIAATRLILETELETTSGVVRLIDFMPPRGKIPTSFASSKVCAAEWRCGWS